MHQGWCIGADVPGMMHSGWCTGTDAPGFHKWVRHAKCTWSSSYSKGYYYLCLTPTCPLSCSNWQSSSMRATTLSSSIPPASKTPLSNIFDDPSYIYTLLMGEYCGVYMIFVFHESHMNLNQNQFSHQITRYPWQLIIIWEAHKYNM